MDVGSQRARDLLETSGGRFHTLLTRITLRDDAADDLLQELFLKLSRSRGFARAAQPEAYAYRAAVRMAFDWRRRQRRQTVVPLEDCDAADRGASPLARLAAREELKTVLAAIERLSAEGQQVLTLRFLEGQSYESIAAQLGRTTHRTRSICHKALKRVRQLMTSNQTNNQRPKRS